MIQWHRTVIPAMVRWRQKDQEFKANVDYTVRLVSDTYTQKQILVK